MKIFKTHSLMTFLKIKHNFQTTLAISTTDTKIIKKYDDKKVELWILRLDKQNITKTETLY